MFWLGCCLPPYVFIIVLLIEASFLVKTNTFFVFAYGVCLCLITFLIFLQNDEPVEETPATKPIVGIIYPPPEVRNIVDKTASFVARLDTFIYVPQ